MKKSYAELPTLKASCNQEDGQKKISESGRLSNLCTRIGLFSLKIRKSSAESGRVGSPGNGLNITYQDEPKSSFLSAGRRAIFTPWLTGFSSW